MPRNLRPLLALLGSLLMTWPAAAQQVYYIKLESQPLEVPACPFFIKQVADGRPNRALGIGTVLRGLGNVPHPAGLQPSPALALQAVCNAQLPARPTDQSVLAVVRALFVQENMAFSTEQARDDLGLAFYLLDAADQAHFALSTTDYSLDLRTSRVGHHQPPRG